MNMKYLFLGIALVLSSSCARNSSETWEDVKTAGRYMQRGLDALWGKEYESRMLTSDDEFIGPDDNDEFIPLDSTDLKTLAFNSDSVIPQPKDVPGEKGIPSLESFYTPSDEIGFQKVHFQTDQHVLYDKADLIALQRIADYLKKHPNAYFMIEGHTDERASASYNLALGMRRANYIRSILVKNGVDPNRIYTVSKGKEHPIALGHSPEDWKQNRRAEYRMFER